MSYGISQDESPAVDARHADHEIDASGPSRKAPGFGWFFSDVVWVEPKDDASDADDTR